jgi:hypothetical protein
MKTLDELDRWIAGRVRAWSSKVSGGQPRELLEVRRDILADVRDRVEPKGEGRSVFAWDTVSIQLAAQTSDQAELWRAALGEEGGLEQDVRALLSEAGCMLPASFSVTVTMVDDPALAENDHPFRIEYARSGGRAVVKSAASERPAAKLTVIRGETESPEFEIASDRVNIGRLKEVLDNREGLRRRNDIAFADSETTVSREHAYIQWDAATGRFRVHDCGSQRGTSVFRDGRRVEVAKGNPRGVQLQSGDEISVGAARLRFSVE